METVRCSITWATPLVPFALVIFQIRSCVFACGNPPISNSMEAGIIGVYHMPSPYISTYSDIASQEGKSDTAPSTQPHTNALRREILLVSCFIIWTSTLEAPSSKDTFQAPMRAPCWILRPLPSLGAAHGSFARFLKLHGPGGLYFLWSKWRLNSNCLRSKEQQY
jgi:hypothetical protein